MKIVGILFALLAAFLIYVSTRSSEFRYVRSGLINASPEKIFPYLISFKLGAEWNPYDQKDPNMKRIFSGTDSQVGSKMEFDGNKEAGSGSLEILNIIPNQSVEIRLLMTKPMSADNRIQYSLTPEGAATRFSWAMSGDAGFMGKLVGVFIDCEKMVAGDFEKGISNLKTKIESQK